MDNYLYIQNWVVTIPHAETTKFTIYKIRVTYKSVEWYITCRYSILHQFDKNLRERFTTLRFPAFPPKKTFGSLDPGFVEIRRKALEVYLQRICNNPRYYCKLLAEFLDPDNRSITVDSFFLPLPPRGTKYPACITLENGEEFYPVPLIDGLHTGLAFLDELRHILEASSIERKLALLDERRNKMVTISNTLDRELNLVHNILTDGLIPRTHPPLYDYLQLAHECGRRGLSWATNIEQKILQEFSPEVTLTEEEGRGEGRNTSTEREFSSPFSIPVESSTLVEDTTTSLTTTTTTTTKSPPLYGEITSHNVEPLSNILGTDDESIHGTIIVIDDYNNDKHETNYSTSTSNHHEEAPLGTLYTPSETIDNIPPTYILSSSGGTPPAYTSPSPLPTAPLYPSLEDINNNSAILEQPEETVFTNNKGKGGNIYEEEPSLLDSTIPEMEDSNPVLIPPEEVIQEGTSKKGILKNVKIMKKKEPKKMDIGEKLQYYERKAESIILGAVDGSLELSVVMERMDKLKKKIMDDKIYWTARMDAVDAAKLTTRINNIVVYIDENKELVKRLRSLYAEEQIARFEEEMYLLLDGANNQGEDIEENTKFYHRITKLMKEMALCHQILRKKEDKLHLLNQVEDLQENLADFEHDFLNRYTVRLGMEERAKAKLKNRKVREAEQRMENVASDMFEL